ncbi:MAG: radical SAM protein [Desulfobacterales bacterium]|nr:radical SAM protein [Desulfobacterales bacterium]
MRILFVQPGFNETANEYPPVGICHLASQARHKGHTVDIYDVATIDGSWSQAKTAVGQFDPDVLCLSLYTIGLLDQYQFLKWVKQQFPECVVVAGGPHATSLPVYTMQECAAIDYLVFGEGEQTLVELLEALDDKTPVDAVQGLCFRNSQKINRNEPRQMIADLDDLCLPAYDLIFDKGFRYRRRSFTLTHKVGVIMSSRGCPFNCAFCFKATFGNKLRRRSPQKVVAEMMWQIECFGVTEFQFLDDLFAVNSKWLHEFHQELDRQKVKIPWKCLSRVNSVTQTDLIQMYQHGCYGLEFGVESGSDEILATAGKGITTSQVRKAFKMAKKIGFLTFGFFIFGLENDTIDTIKKTRQFAVAISPDLCGFAVLLPFPGTQVYERLPRNLRFKWSIFNSYYDKNRLPISLCDVAPRDLMRYARQADAEVSGSFSYLIQNVLFRRGGRSELRKEAFNKWFKAVKTLTSRRMGGQPIFDDGNRLANFFLISRNLVVLAIIRLCLVGPNNLVGKFRRQTTQSQPPDA